MTAQMPALTDFNAWADYWYYTIGVNPIPANSKRKVTIEMWKEGEINFQENSLPEELFIKWKRENKYKNGIAIIAGKIWRGQFKDNYLSMIDADNLKALEEICTAIGGERDGKTLSIKEIARHFIVEQHKDNTSKAHIYIIAPISIQSKTSDAGKPGLKEKIARGEIPAFEIKGDSRFLSYTTPGLHKNGHPYEIIGTIEPKIIDKGSALQIQTRLNEMAKRYGISYLNNAGNTDKIPIGELFKEDTVIYEGHNRHEGLLRVMESLIARNSNILTLDQIREIAYKWNQKHCVPPLDDKEFEKQWRDATNFIAKSHNTLTAEKHANNSDEEKTFNNDADVLYHLVSNKIVESFRDYELGTPYAVLDIEGQRRVYNMESEEFALALRLLFKAHINSISSGKVFGLIHKEYVNTVINTLLAECRTTRTLYQRALFDGQAAYYDLANDNYEYIVINQDGKYEIKNDSYRIFRPARRHTQQVKPEESDKGGALMDKTIASFNIEDNATGDKKLLLKVGIISLLAGKDYMLSNPIWTFNGPPGASKTTCALWIMSLIDPVDDGSVNRAKTGVMTWSYKPDADRDRKLSVARNYLTIFDNLVRIKDEESGELCTYSTGGEVRERKLRTNTDLVEYSVKGHVMYTSVKDLAMQDDLIRRQIQFNINLRLDYDAERKFWTSRFAERPAILDYIFRTFGKAIPIYNKIVQDPDFRIPGRLGDFIQLGEAISQAMGEKPGRFVAITAALNREQSERTLNNNPLAGLVTDYILNKLTQKMQTSKDGPTIKILSSELFEGIKNRAIEIGYNTDYLPSTASKFGNSIPALEIPLLVAGIEIKKLPRESQGQPYRITIRPKEEKECDMCKAIYNGNGHSEEDCKRYRRAYQHLKIIMKDDDDLADKKTIAAELRKTDDTLTEQDAGIVISIYERTVKAGHTPAQA